MIEEYKKSKLTLEEKKERLNNQQVHSIGIEELRANRKSLRDKMHQMLTSRDAQAQHKNREVRNTIIHESISLYKHCFFC